MANCNAIYAKAQQLGACSMLTGRENNIRLMQLLKTPQGIEFCTKNNFPDLATFREFRGALAESFGIYIDTDVTLDNVSKVILVGKTHARLRYDDPTKRHQVILMHGATAEIAASNWAVVFVDGQGASSTVTDNARVL